MSLPDSPDAFVQQVSDDLYLDMEADRTDCYSRPVSQPVVAGRRPAERVTAARYEATRYQAGWLDGGAGWEIDRPRHGHPKCCEVRGPLVAPSWTPEELAAHLDLVDWIADESRSLRCPAIDLPAAFDAILFASRLGAIHRRVIEPPRQVLQQLQLLGTGIKTEVSVPEDTDTPAAGKLAWRLAWLDRTGFTRRPDGTPVPDPAVADWSPFYAALRAALAESGPWADLFAACVAAAEYVTYILRGGLGPALRFDTSGDRP